jgi:hypothetical protein
MESVLDDLENLTRSSSSSTAPASAAQPSRPSAPSQPGGTVQTILQACGLVDALAQSVCLRCASRVLAMDTGKHATLYCKELFRDVEVPITACTAFQPEPEASTP